ncbi:hypothetical protein V1477_001471 [Vespula maculifrons]|uniref:Uncharacterized protein n=1 Tax=Vespula maculifrons TaxID=7453 RepID=A0ABD2D057_VESMC
MNAHQADNSRLAVLFNFLFRFINYNGVIFLHSPIGGNFLEKCIRSYGRIHSYYIDLQMT